MQTASQPRIETEAQTLFLKQVLHLCSAYLRLSAGLDLNPISTSFMNLYLSLNTIYEFTPDFPLSSVLGLSVCIFAHTQGREKG